ncbi:hypothetical protein ACFX2A_024422 [Malus domestica]
MDGNNRNLFKKRPNIQFKRRGGNNNYKKGKWNDSSHERVIIIYSSPTKISSKQSNHENLADGNEMEPHCAAQDALLKVHDRIVEEDRFGGVTFDDDNENSVVTTRLLVPNC